MMHPGPMLGSTPSPAKSDLQQRSAQGISDYSPEWSWADVSLDISPRNDFVRFRRFFERKKGIPTCSKFEQKLTEEGVFSNLRIQSETKPSFYRVMKKTWTRKTLFSFFFF
jgi:hypothetical protein